MDTSVLLAAAFLVFSTLGVLYAGIAAYYYFRFERRADLPRLPIALSALVGQYVLLFVLSAAGGYVLLPTILMFLVGLSLAMTVWLGLTAHSRAGTRAALSGIFALLGYVFFFGTVVVWRI